MPLNCPNCGAHLAPLFTSHASTQCAPYSCSGKEAGTHIGQIKNLMCAPVFQLGRREEQPTMRPVFGALQDVRARATLSRVAEQMHAAIHAAGEGSVDSLVESRRRGGRYHKHAWSDYPARVFEAVGAIIYAMEWTGSTLGVDSQDDELMAARASAVPPRDVYGAALPRLFELMLVVDYGFPPYPLNFGSRSVSGGGCRRGLENLEDFCGILVAVAWRWKQQQGLPSSEVWDKIYDAAKQYWVYTNGFSFGEVSVWDIATMLYYYVAHREPVGPQDREQGWTGYTSVLQQMIAEIPFRGKDRLERKLSLDAHLLIPRFVRDWKLRTQMIVMVNDLAARHGCQLAPPKMPKPPVWERLFSRQRSRLVENVEEDVEKEKVLELDTDTLSDCTATN